MLVKITLFALLAFSIVSCCKSIFLRRFLYLLAGVFVAFQLFVIELKGDFAGYIDYEELYLSGGAASSPIASLSSTSWLHILSAALLLSVLLALFLKLFGQVKGVNYRKVNLQVLLVMSLALISFVSSITLYRYTYVVVRTLVENTQVTDDWSQTYELRVNSKSDRTVLSALSDSQFGSDYSVIAHATGGNLSFRSGVALDGDGTSVDEGAVREQSIKYTNSLQALNYSIQDGKKLIEVDFLTTSDGVLIGGHDWPRVKAIIGYNGEYDRKKQDSKPLSFAEFERLRANSDIKPLDIKLINEIFKANENLVLITDKTHDYPNLVKHYDFPDRLIVECFNLFQCKRAQKYGIKNVALNVYMKNRDLVNYLVRNQIRFVTYRGVTEQDAVGYANAVVINRAGIVTLVYTSADNLDYMRENIGVTASAIYTDYFSLERGELVTYDKE